MRYTANSSGNRVASSEFGLGIAMSCAIVVFFVGLSFGRSWSVLTVHRSKPHAAILIVDPLAAVEVATAAPRRTVNTRAARFICAMLTEGRGVSKVAPRFSVARN